MLIYLTIFRKSMIVLTSYAHPPDPPPLPTNPIFNKNKMHKEISAFVGLETGILKECV